MDAQGDAGSRSKLGPLGSVHPNPSEERKSTLYLVEVVGFPRDLAHCHGVDYRGGFAIFWIVEDGLKREIWSSNKHLIVRELPEGYVPKSYWPANFGIFALPGFFDSEVYGFKNGLDQFQRRQPIKGE